MPNIKFVTKADGKLAEQADIAVCANEDFPSRFSDDVVGVCTMCPQKIKYRPSIPTKPKKVCMECAKRLMRQKTMH